MKIPNSEEIKKWDLYTIKNEPISSYNLMERAGKNCFLQIIKIFPKKTIHIIANKGNNGGDGLVIFKHLLKKQTKCKLTIIDITKTESKNFTKNLSIIPEEYYTKIKKTEELVIQKTELIIDCVFGNGLNQPISGVFGEIIDKINKSQAQILSIDLPSGLFSNENRENNGKIIKAHYTFTFQIPKISLLLPSYERYYGKVYIIPIGLSKHYLKSIKSNYNYIIKDSLPPLIKRGKFSHKGNYGHGLLIGGCENMKGAIILASTAAMKSGIGKISVNLPDEYIKDLNIQLPEAIINNQINPFDLDKYNAIGIGPGFGDYSKDKDNLINTILTSRKKKPIVIDADGINIISKNKILLQNCNNTIFTPHVKEFKRLIGSYKSDEEKLDKQIKFSKTYNLIVVLKGAHTTISTPDNLLYFNSTGNNGLAKAGSGDVLTGLLVSLLSQGYSLINAAIIGVFIHGYSAEICLKNETMETMTPSNIINNFEKAFKLIK